MALIDTPVDAPSDVDPADSNTDPDTRKGHDSSVVDVVDDSKTRKSRDSSVVEVIDLLDSDKDVESDIDFFIDKTGNIASSSELEDNEPLAEFYPVGNGRESTGDSVQIFLCRAKKPSLEMKKKRKIKKKWRKKKAGLRKEVPEWTADLSRKRTTTENVETSSLVEEIEKFSKANGITTPPRNFHLQFEGAEDPKEPSFDEGFIGGSISLDESDAVIIEESVQGGTEEEEDDVILVENEPSVIELSDTDNEIATPGPSRGKKRKKKSLTMAAKKKRKTPQKSVDPNTKLRPIVIDGSNVAFGFGRTEKKFAAKGIKLCVEYFEKRGHDHIIAFVPQFRRRHPLTVDPQILDELEDKGYVTYTPSRQVNGQKIVSYDDRYIVEYANKVGGVIISRDNFRDIWQDSPDFRDTIDKRLLMFTFAKDTIMFPDDPLGRSGPRLPEFLAFPNKV